MSTKDAAIISTTNDAKRNDPVAQREARECSSVDPITMSAVSVVPAALLALPLLLLKSYASFAARRTGTAAVRSAGRASKSGSYASIVAGYQRNTLRSWLAASFMINKQRPQARLQSACLAKLVTEEASVAVLLLRVTLTPTLVFELVRPHAFCGFQCPAIAHLCIISTF